MVLLLPPCNSYQRLLIHRVIDEYPGLCSFSVGVDPDRQTAVCPRDIYKRKMCSNNGDPVLMNSHNPRVDVDATSQPHTSQSMTSKPSLANRDAATRRKTKKPEMAIYVPRARRMLDRNPPPSRSSNVTDERTGDLTTRGAISSKSSRFREDEGRTGGDNGVGEGDTAGVHDNVDSCVGDARREMPPYQEHSVQGSRRKPDDGSRGLARERHGGKRDGGSRERKGSERVCVNGREQSERYNQVRRECNNEGEVDLARSCEIQRGYRGEVDLARSSEEQRGYRDHYKPGSMDDGSKVDGYRKKEERNYNRDVGDVSRNANVPKRQAGRGMDAERAFGRPRDMRRDVDVDQRAVNKPWSDEGNARVTTNRSFLSCVGDSDKSRRVNVRAMGFREAKLAGNQTRDAARGEETHARGEETQRRVDDGSEMKKKLVPKDLCVNNLKLLNDYWEQHGSSIVQGKATKCDDRWEVDQLGYERMEMNDQNDVDQGTEQDRVFESKCIERSKTPEGNSDQGMGGDVEVKGRSLGSRSDPKNTGEEGGASRIGKEPVRDGVHSGNDETNESVCDVYEGVLLGQTVVPCRSFLTSEDSGMMVHSEREVSPSVAVKNTNDVGVVEVKDKSLVENMVSAGGGDQNKTWQTWVPARDMISSFASSRSQSPCSSSSDSSTKLVKKAPAQRSWSLGIAETLSRENGRLDPKPGGDQSLDKLIRVEYGADVSLLKSGGHVMGSEIKSETAVNRKVKFSRFSLEDSNLGSNYSRDSDQNIRRQDVENIISPSIKYCQEDKTGEEKGYVLLDLINRGRCDREMSGMTDDGREREAGRVNAGASLGVCPATMMGCNDSIIPDNVPHRIYPNCRRNPAEHAADSLNSYGVIEGMWRPYSGVPHDRGLLRCISQETLQSAADVHLCGGEDSETVFATSIPKYGECGDTRDDTSHGFPHGHRGVRVGGNVEPSSFDARSRRDYSSGEFRFDSLEPGKFGARDTLDGMVRVSNSPGHDRTENAPAHDRTENAPAHDRTENAPAHDRTENAPAHDRTENAPAHDRTENAPAHDRTENAPAHDRTENAPAHDRTENAPAHDRTENAPAHDRTENAPAHDRTENAPGHDHTETVSCDINNASEEIPLEDSFSMGDNLVISQLNIIKNDANTIQDNRVNFADNKTSSFGDCTRFRDTIVGETEDKSHGTCDSSGDKGVTENENNLGEIKTRSESPKTLEKRKNSNNLIAIVDSNHKEADCFGDTDLVKTSSGNQVELQSGVKGISVYRGDSLEEGELRTETDTYNIINNVCEGAEIPGMDEPNSVGVEGVGMEGAGMEGVEGTGVEGVGLEDSDESCDEDSWFNQFDDNGDCLDPLKMKELEAAVGKVQVVKPHSSKEHYKVSSVKRDVDSDDFSHVLEIYDFPAELVTSDLMQVFFQYQARGVTIKWVDDTHALAVFSTHILASEALSSLYINLKLRPLSDATPLSRSKARSCLDYVQPYKERPQTSAITAHRMVAGALGMAPKISREQRDEERRKLGQAREKRRQDKRNQETAWDGTYGRCAMDEV